MVQMMEDENAAFWLPTHFLTDDDFFSAADDNNKLPTVNNKNNNSGFGLGFGSDPFDSPVSSPDNDENDDALLISHLTRHLAQTSIYDKNNTTTTSEKPWLFSTSPQSTLSGFGGGWSNNNNRSGFSSNSSPNGPSRVPSPPLTPELKNDAAWDLLYEAAGQVARLKMNAIAAQLNNNNNNNNRGLLGAPRRASNKPAHHHHPLYNNQYQELKWAQERETGSNYCPHHHHHHHHNNHQQGRSCGGTPGLSQTAWPPLRTRQPHHHNHNHNHNHQHYNCGSQMRSMYQGGSGGVGVKRQSAGTGVFLPRRVSTSPPRHHHNHKNPTVLLPSSRAVHQELEATNLDSHSRFGGVEFPTDFDMRMARRNAAAVLGQQRRNTAMVGPGHEIRLPNDWTY